MTTPTEAAATVESVRARWQAALELGAVVYVVAPRGHALAGHPDPIVGARVISPGEAFDLDPHMYYGYDHPRRAAVLLAFPDAAYVAYDLATGEEFSRAAYGPGAP